MSTVLFDNPWDVEGKIEEENVRMKNRHGRLSAARAVGKQKKPTARSPCVYAHDYRRQAGFY